MKTNKVIIIKFMGIEIQQQTEGGLINIKNIVDLVNKERKLKDKEKKSVDKYFKSKNGQEYLEALLIKLDKISEISNRHNYANSFSPSEINELGLSIAELQKFSMDDIKSFEIYKKTRGKNEGTWFTPLLALDIVGWLSPKIRLEFNDIVLKELYKKRIDISDLQTALTDAIIENLGKPTDSQFYSILGYEINQYVFNKSYIGIRNDADEEEFNRLTKLLNGLIFLIKNNIILSHVHLISKIKEIKL